MDFMDIKIKIINLFMKLRTPIEGSRIYLRL